MRSAFRALSDVDDLPLDRQLATQPARRICCIDSAASGPRPGATTSEEPHLRLRLAQHAAKHAQVAAARADRPRCGQLVLRGDRVREVGAPCTAALASRALSGGRHSVTTSSFLVSVRHAPAALPGLCSLAATCGIGSSRLEPEAGSTCRAAGAQHLQRIVPGVAV